MAFQERSRVNAGRSMPLKVNKIAAKFVRARAEKMIESDLKESCRRGVRRYVSADTRFGVVAAHDHRHRVPADDTFDLALKVTVAGIERLFALGDRIDIRRIDGKRERDAGFLGADLQLVKDLPGLFQGPVFEDIIQGAQPFFDLYIFDFRCLTARFIGVHTFPFLCRSRFTPVVLLVDIDSSSSPEIVLQFWGLIPGKAKPLLGQNKHGGINFLLENQVAPPTVLLLDIDSKSQNKRGGALISLWKLMPEERFELSWDHSHTPLKRACLPISPLRLYFA